MNKLIQFINKVITKPNITEGYYQIKTCEECGCPLFPNEIMCPDCLKPLYLGGSYEDKVSLQ